MTFAVDLYCVSCEERVKTTLDEIDGVSAVDVDAGEQLVEVTFNPYQIDSEQLRGQIADLGFNTDVIETSPPPAD